VCLFPPVPGPAALILHHLLQQVDEGILIILQQVLVCWGTSGIMAEHSGPTLGDQVLQQVRLGKPGAADARQAVLVQSESSELPERVEGFGADGGDPCIRHGQAGHRCQGFTCEHCGIDLSNIVHQEHKR
ncbi:hypothetical protein Z043_117587, partial [Scleropages formosus]